MQAITYSNNGPWATRAFVTAVEYMTGRLWLEHNYWKCLEEHDRRLAEGQDIPFFNMALEWMGITADYDEDKLNAVPSDQPLLVVCNHPFGIIDGLMINHLLYKRRSDYQILTNEVLLKADRVSPWLIPVDDSDTASGTTKNQRTILQSMRRLRNNGCICVFPAGRLSRAPKIGAPAQDLPWKPLIAHLALRAKTPEGKRPQILPVYFQGQNSWIFQWATRINPLVSRSLVIHEAKNKQKKTMRVEIGELIDVESLPHHDNAELFTQNLQDLTMSLKTTP